MLNGGHLPGEKVTPDIARIEINLLVRTLSVRLSLVLLIQKRI